MQISPMGNIVCRQRYHHRKELTTLRWWAKKHIWDLQKIPDHVPLTLV